MANRKKIGRTGVESSFLSSNLHSIGEGRAYLGPGEGSGSERLEELVIRLEGYDQPISSIKIITRGYDQEKYPGAEDVVTYYFITPNNYVDGLEDEISEFEENLNEEEGISCKLGYSSVPVDDIFNYPYLGSPVWERDAS